jgi:hypothetical protein
LLLVLTLSSCKKENALDCFKSNGTEITKTLSPGTFNTIQLASKIQLFVHQGNEYKVEVTAGKHIIKNISAKVVGNTLEMDNNNTCNFVRGYKKNVTVHVTLPYLKFVKNDGVGTITISDFVQDTLVVRAESSGDIRISGNYNQVRTSSHGNGDMYVNGTAKSFLVYANGTNFVHAENLLVKDFVFVQTVTLGDCFVNASILQELVYNIGSSGNIYYTGNPPVVKDVSEVKAKGKAIKE